VLHAVQADQRAGSSQSGLAMDGNRARFRFRCRQPLRNDFIRGRCTIDKEEIQVLNALLRKLSLLVLRLVQPHN